MKQLKDERITRATNKITAKMFWVISPLMLVLLVGKLIVRVEWQMMILEVVSFLISGLYVVIQKLRMGTMLVGKKDAALKEIDEAIYSKAFMIDFWIVITGELVLMLMGLDMAVLSWYFAVWMIPALIITVYSIRHGLLIWGGKQRRTDVSKDFAKRVVVGALAFGLFMGWPMLFREGQFRPGGIL